MKKTIVYIGLAFLAINVLLWLMLSAYLSFNMMANSAVIVINSVLIWLLWKTKQKTAFAISLTFIFSVISIIQLVLGSLVSDSFQDNMKLLAILILLIIEIILFVIVNAISKNIK